MTNSYFLYARKSTDVEDKQVRSIEDQLDRLARNMHGGGNIIEWVLHRLGGEHEARASRESEARRVSGRSPARI